MGPLTITYEIEDWQAREFVSSYSMATREIRVGCPNIVLDVQKNVVRDCVDIVAQLYLGHKVPVAPPTVTKETVVVAQKTTAVAKAVAEVSITVPTRLGVLFPWLPRRWTTRTVTRRTEVWQGATESKTTSVDTVSTATTVMVIDPNLQFGPGKPYTVQRSIRHQETGYERWAEVQHG